MNSKGHLNKKKIAVCIAILLFIILIILINALHKPNRYKKLSVLLNNEIVDVTTTVVINERGTIFLDLEDVIKFFDENLYYNKVEKQIISTYNTHVALLELNKIKAYINDEEKTLKSPVYIDETSGIVFVPISELEDVYDIEVKYHEKTNRVVIDSLSKEKTESRVVKKTKLKNRKGPFAKTIEKVLIGDTVSILDSSGNMKKVRIESDGEIGFIKAKALDNETKVRENVVYSKPELKVYENYDNINGVYDKVDTEKDKLNVVNPVFFEINKESKVVDKSMTSTATYQVYSSWAEESGLKIMPSCINLDSVSNNLLTYNQRIGIINLLVKRTKEYGFVGINIDFDQIDDVNSFYRFITELEPRFKEEGLYVSVTIKNGVDISRSRIQNIVDYVVEE